MKEKFINIHHYNRYMYAVGIAEQINEAMDSRSYTVVDEDLEPLREYFAFESFGSPVIKLGCFVLIGFDVVNSLIHIPPKKEIKKMFKGFKIMKLHEIKIRW